MAIVLGMPILWRTLADIHIGAHVYSSINQARQEAEFKRTQMLELEYEKKLGRLSGSQKGASKDNERRN